MHSIQTKITAITVVAILTSILSVFATSFTILQNETDENSVGMMTLIAKDAAKSLEVYFESIEQSVEIAANIATDNLDSVFLLESGATRTTSEQRVQTAEQKAALDAYLKEYCGKIQEYLSGVAGYTHGVTAYYYCINPEISETEHGFYYMQRGKTGFIRQQPLDAAKLAPVDKLHGTWYEAAIRRGCPLWISNYSTESYPDTLICSYFVPIYKAGMTIGVMGMDIPCSTLTDQISGIKVYGTGFVSLLDEDGQVIYHPDIPAGGYLNSSKRGLPVEVFEKESSGDNLIRYKMNGQERQMSFMTLDTGMKLLCIAPANEINAPWIRLVRVILMIAAVSILFFVILVLFLMGVIILPLKQLTSASRRLAKADYDVDLNYNGNDEIGTLTAAFKIMRDQIKRYVEDLNHQIYHDKLTDLPNMRHFFKLSERAKSSIQAAGQEPVMLYFDIVGLRFFNRQYGFERGDQLIVNFADILERKLGKHRACRFSGDHFAAMTDEDHMREIVSSILEECETAAAGDRLPVRVGAYPYRLEIVDTSTACDRAKYACDQKRGEFTSSFTVFDEKMLKKGEINRHIMNNLDKALEEGWVKVYYQPIVCATAEVVCDEEALARWVDPELGFLSPGIFIPALEDSKLIYKLDLYVVDKVLEKMKQQKDFGLPVVPHSINLSRMDFESCDVVEEIRKRVDAAGIDRSMITIEITESVIGSDFDFMSEQIIRFRDLGFPVWMDDFGSGYSSLDVLQEIRFDLIKFDMRFMKRFSEGEESKIILTNLTQMANALGIETVCEGVEEKAQAEFLRRIGCTKIQGYYYGKPAPPKAV